MSSLLLLYQSELQGKIEAITKVVESVTCSMHAQKAARTSAGVDYVPPPTTGPESRGELVRSAFSSLAEARELLPNVESEISALPSQEDRDRFRKTLEPFRGAIEGLQGTLTALREQVAAAERDDLLCFSRESAGKGVGESHRVDIATEASRRSALNVTNKLYAGTSHLEKAEGLLHRTNASGHETMQTLRQQTDQIRGMGEEAGEIHEELSQATAILQDMHRRALRHKLYLYGVIGAVGLVLLLVIAKKLT